MGLEITLSLDDTDLDYFRRLIQLARNNTSDEQREAAVRTARDNLNNIPIDELSWFSAQKVRDTHCMVAMLVDPEWPLSDSERQAITTGLVYFNQTQDLIPDELPVLGYVDDAIMLELIHRELAPELEAYKEFCEYRSYATLQPGEHGVEVSREAWLKDKREQLFSRMRARRKRASSSTNVGLLTSLSGTS